ncbi:MAG: PIN domain-containing protein [Anaerolineae bacterium]|nr:PIN domain-containing protein [Anaerolineae bacterium]
MPATPSGVFFDASVLFAAAYSESGYACDLIRLAIRGRIQAVVNQDVLTEVAHNINRSHNYA